MISRPPNRLRLYAFVFAVFLGLNAMWLLAAELTRAELPFFPASEAEAQTAAARSAVAAWIGWPRGDLWVDYAMSVDAALIGSVESGTTSNSQNASNELRLITERAVALAPYDSRAWLMLATINSSSASQAKRAPAQIKMSYYTSPNDVRLMPFRVQIATRSAALADDELQSLVENEIHSIVLRHPELKPSIAAAYRGASPAGRRFLEIKLAGVDAALLAELRAAKP